MFRINYKAFITAPAAILCFIAPFIHKAGFNGTQYFSQDTFTLTMIIAGIMLVASFIPVINVYSPVFSFLGTFTALLAFVKVSYLYLSSVFFSGIADTIPGILEQIGFHYSFCLFAYVGAMLASIVAMFLPDDIA